MERGEEAREIQEIHSRKERKANLGMTVEKKNKSEVKRSQLKIAEISKITNKEHKNAKKKKRH